MTSKSKGMVVLIVIVALLTISACGNNVKEAGEMSKDRGYKWPTSEMLGVPELQGEISNINREDDVIRLEVYVEGEEIVNAYMQALEQAGFSFDGEPKIVDGHVQLLGFKDSNILNFAYKGSEKLVFIEYSK